MTKNHRRAILFCLSLFLTVVSVKGQDLDSLLSLNAYTEESELQKILNKNVTVSSQKALTTRETPGIISLITAEEIQNVGARDLIDVLRLVPGFEVMQDLQFVMGLGLRGSWANEGKVLVMMDGQPFNDLLYQVVAVGNRFPVDAIERIEIIRGPGSAIYGGSAEYGVINIITKAADNLNGVVVYGTGGLHADVAGRTNAGFMAAKRNQHFSWDASVFRGKGIVSDRSYTELGGTDVYDLGSVTAADPMNINAGLKIKNFSLRAMYDEYETNDPIMFVAFKNFFADMRYTAKVSDKLTITPQVKYYNQLPWSYGSVETDEYDFHARATRLLSQTDVSYNPSRKVNINAGALYFIDRGDFINVLETFSGETDLKLNNYAFYTQALFKHRLFNATAGFRFEKNNRYDGAFVPRLALTKKIENFHFKILYSKSFRAPSIQNINIHLYDQAKPEKSTVFEAEFGYQFTPEMLLAVNAFSIRTRDVLIYGSEGEGADFAEWYENFEKSGSQGIEAVYTIRKKGWYTTFTYSFSRAAGGNTVATYAVPQSATQFVGFPAHKVTLNTCIYLTPSISFNPSFVYTSKRFAYTSLDDEEYSVMEELDPSLLTNVFFNFRELLMKRLTIGAGVYDLLNQRPAIPQPYDGYYAPIPGRSREYVLKLSYQINFNK